MAKHKTHYEDCDVLVVGGGMAIPPPTTNTSQSS